jgi:DNA-binding transcriptional LysR family regulator
MNFRQIEAVYHVVKAGTFGAAARELHLTQSALSHRIRTFEEELGSSLFVRGRRRATLTKLGEDVATRAERIFAELVDIKRLLGRGGAWRKTESLRVTATNIGITYLYGAFFEEFIRRYPDVDLQIVAAESGDDAVRRVRDRSADVTLTSTPKGYSGVEAIALGNAEIVLIAGARHPIARLARPRLEDVRRWPFVRYLPGSGARAASDEIFGDARGYPRILTESSDTEYVKRMVSLGLGLSLVPLFTIQSELKTGSLRAVRLKGCCVIQEFGLVLRKGFRPPLVDRFADVCVDISREHPKSYLLGGRPRKDRRLG